MNDKKIEINRYNKKANQILKKKHYYNKISDYLKPPYEYYFKLLKKFKKKKILEIGAGMGENTLPLVQLSSNNVCSTDISPKSIEVMNRKFSKYKNFSSQIVDMEKLPFKSQSFDIICSAGSLAYGDNDAVMNECYRVAKRGGHMIVVDSLNHNPIYRLNRYLNYLLGKRTRNVLKRIPNNNLINRYIKKFGYGKVKFFGSITWTFPLLKILLDEKTITKISNWIDQILKVKKSAFKFVLILNKRK